MFKEGQDQFVPFIITIVAIIFTDLLIGIGIGLVVGIIYVIYTNNRSAISTVRDKGAVLILFKKDVSFLNKARLVEVLDTLRPGDYVFIDGVRAQFIDHDIYSTLEDFKLNAHFRNITVEFKGTIRRKVSYRKTDAIVQKTLISE
ncbi:MAG: hypothetical protein R2822_12010 [Spirosomataceae bacterium]